MPGPEADGDGEVELKARVPFRARITTKGVFLFLCFVTTGTLGPVTLARWSGVATNDGVKELGKSIQQKIKSDYDPKISALTARIEMDEATLRKLEGGQQETKSLINQGRAESLANIAADRVKDARRSRQIRDLVFERALDNLNNHRPVHTGLDEYLFR